MDNFGAGNVYVQPSAALADAPNDARFYIAYDRTNPDHAWNEAYVAGAVHPRHVIDTGVVRVDRRVDELGQVKKTVRGSLTFTESLYQFSTLWAAVHYERGDEVMLASAEVGGGPLPISFTEVCVDLPTQTLAAEGACDGLDTQDMTFLDLPTESRAEFPAGFPEQPTF